AMGADAVLVQDLGVARMLRQCAPDLPLHASTQMTVCSLDGVKTCADLGMTRAVLSRELSRGDIAHICAHSPIEIEVFVHGALCMCYSGQCFFSSVLGGRSGNRGLCAQPCRLNYGWGEKPNGYPLSLKDMSLANHLSELRRMGVSCVKIEGRMKRPEYVAIVTRVYADAIRENRPPSPEELEKLAQAFSRSGFTDGYYEGHKGPELFGVREDTQEPRELFAAARATYQRETPRIPVKLCCMVKAGEPVQLGVEDGFGRVATAKGEVPQEARTRPLTQEGVELQIAKTGGTPYLCEKSLALVDEGLSLPVSSLNALRREALDGLTAQRVAMKPRRQEPYHGGVRYEDSAQPPQLNLSLSRAQQATRELFALSPALVYLPVGELINSPDVAELAERYGVTLAVNLPRIVLEGERAALEKQLEAAKGLGVTQALLGNWGHL
ncbi:MAG: U32 family peptidase, partial [Pseudoflavonifractor sp.]